MTTTPTPQPQEAARLSAELKALRRRRSGIVCGLLTAAACDKLDAEQDALIDALAALAQPQAQPGQVDEAQAGSAADRVDAERYRWLRDEAINFGGDEPSAWCVVGTCYEDQIVCDGIELEKVIDAARAAGDGAKHG